MRLKPFNIIARVTHSKIPAGSTAEEAQKRSRPTSRHSPGAVHARGGVRDHRGCRPRDAFVGDGSHRVRDDALDAAEVRDAIDRKSVV